MLIRISTAFLLLALSMTCVGSPLGYTSDYNVLTFGSLTGLNGDIGGSTAVGGGASFTNYALASADGLSNGVIPPGGAGTLNLVVGGSLAMTNAQLHKGSGIYAGAASLTNVGHPDGTLSQGVVPVDFAALQAQAQQATTSFATMTATGTGVANGDSYTLTGANAGLNVFTIDAGDMDDWRSFSINVPEGAAVLINVVGTGTSFHDVGIFLNGQQFDRTRANQWGEVLWNFVNTPTFSIYGANFGGTILAPTTDLVFNNGQINGQIVAKSLNTSGDIHNFRFNGGETPDEETAVPEPATITLSAAGALLLLAGDLRRRRNAKRSAA